MATNNFLKKSPCLKFSSQIFKMITRKKNKTLKYNNSLIFSVLLIYYVQDLHTNDPNNQRPAQSR